MQPLRLPKVERATKMGMTQFSTPRARPAKDWKCLFIGFYEKVNFTCLILPWTFKYSIKFELRIVRGNVL